MRSPATPNPTKTSYVSTHLALVELKSCVLSSLAKLSDRDTQQIALDDLEKLIRSLPPDGVSGINPAPLFQKLCPRICKLLGVQGYLAKGALLSVISSLAQVGAISPQNMQQVLQSNRDCLENSDWATRKSAADTLCVLSAHSSHLIGDGAASTLSALESCRFDKKHLEMKATLVHLL